MFFLKIKIRRKLVKNYLKVGITEITDVNLSF